MKVQPGITEAELSKELSDITLLYLYKAINVIQKKDCLAYMIIPILNAPLAEIHKIQNVSY